MPHLDPGIVQTSSPARYAFRTKASQFTVHALATGLVSVVAHSPKFAIKDFGGEVSFIPGSLESACLSMQIKTSSLELMDEVDAGTRRLIDRTLFQDVLEASVFPEITFESFQIKAKKVSENRYSASITGSLSLHGVTKAHSFESQVVVGPDTLRAIGEFMLKQSHYGIVPPSFPGGSLRDGLKFAFYIVAQRQTEGGKDPFGLEEKRPRRV
jgi:polyisoprenoid-binding protein YceI